SDYYKETIRLFNKGKYFLYKEKGYTKYDYPEKERFDREYRNCVAAIINCYLAYENKPEA
ncbi:hypothetical protein B0H65DRAFT_392197, partial [Neurospora tetraspora]